MAKPSPKITDPNFDPLEEVGQGLVGTAKWAGNLGAEAAVAGMAYLKDTIYDAAISAWRAAGGGKTTVRDVEGNKIDF